MSPLKETEIAGRISRLEADLAAARSALAEAVAARLAAAEGELASLREDYDVLRAEYSLINEELAQRSAGLLQLRGEKEVALAAAAAAAAEVVGLKKEVERLQGVGTLEVFPLAVEVEAAGAAAVAPPSVTVSAAPAETTPGKALPAAAAESAATSPAAAEEAGWLGDTFPTTDGEVFFRPDHCLSAIPCASADEIIDLRVSVNAIQISSDHTGIPHKCSAYICGIRQHGGKAVYIALHQIDSDRSIVYLPSRQPADQADYDRVMESAIAFADVTGFIINMVYLGGSADDRVEAVRQIPVFGFK
ncbi:MAG TPA: hypothetical protein VJ550_14290 [Geomonas sp.]|nr:hypothetical protein [Geomonas sp.]